MEDQENVETDAVINDTPSTEESPESENTDIPEESEKELTDEELKEEIARLKEEAKSEEDAKEKRHKEQEAGWKAKILKERDKAKVLEEKNQETEELRKSFENTLLEEAYSKTIDDKFGLPYFENLAKTNPDLANKIAQKHWQKTAKELILDTKREFASNGDEELQKFVSEEDIRQTERDKIYHEIAIEQAQTMFDDLGDGEKVEAREYFDEIVEGKKLTPTNAKKYAEMAKLYATRNRKPEDVKKIVDKDRVIADKASTGISPKSGSKEAEVGDNSAIRQQLRNVGISLQQINLMYPLK